MDFRFAPGLSDILEQHEGATRLVRLRINNRPAVGGNRDMVVHRTRSSEFEEVRTQSPNQKYSSCTARIGVGFVLVNGALQVRLNSRSLAVAIFPVNKSQTALETHVVNSSRFVAFAQRRNVERCTNVLGWTTRTLHSRDKFDECLI
jgi:hypothetical protein